MENEIVLKCPFRTKVVKRKTSSKKITETHYMDCLGIGCPYYIERYSIAGNYHVCIRVENTKGE